MNRIYLIINIAFLIFFLPLTAFASAKTEVPENDVEEHTDSCLRIDIETQTSFSSDKTPLWLNANKYGLSSLKESNGYFRASVLRPLSSYANNKEKKYDYSYCADLALTYGYTSTVVVQQAYVEGRWKSVKATLGSKNWEMELKDNQLSSGSQTLGKNARPIPQLRIGLDDYWTVPGTKGGLSLKGHLAYGLMTDQNWQKDFTEKTSKYVENAFYHNKAGYAKIGRDDQRLNLIIGLEMVTIFGGTSYNVQNGNEFVIVENKEHLKDFWNAFIPIFDKGEVIEEGTHYQNTSGNMLGSWVARLNYNAEKWTAGLYIDHFFEDHSQMFFVDYNGYGKGEEWDDKKDARFFMYYPKDMMVGLEWKSKEKGMIDAVVLEYIYTKYQSGPIYHDHTNTISDHIGGNDDYYNHYVQTSYQHWGQVMGNPFFLSPIYNNDKTLEVKNSRFVAYHLGVAGHPVKNLDYRILASFQDGMGTYSKPYNEYKRNFNFMAEATYQLPQNWHITAAFGLDRGNIYGNNTGAQLTVRKTIFK